MQKFKKDILFEIEYYLKKKDEIKKEFESWNNPNRYSQSLILDMRKEMNENLGQLRHDFDKSIDKILQDKLETITPNYKQINSIEYQTKLANVLKLMELSAGKLSEQHLNFMVEANDIDTLEILSKTYATETVLEAKIKADLEGIKREYILLGNTAKNYADYEEQGVPRETILSTFK